MAYNSAYTGSQVDAAVGAVRQKETKWDNKQDELTGTEDQLVGFSSAGEAVAVAKPTAADVGAMPAVTGGTAGQVLTKTEAGQEWQNAPDGLPSGGEEGQVLTKTASGAQWDDIPSDLPAGGTDGQILMKTADGVAWEDAPEGGVTSFNSRTGAVTPQTGDYTADMVGALPTQTGTQGQVLGFTADNTVGAMDAPSGLSISPASATLYSGSWTLSGGKYTQTVQISGVTTSARLILPDPDTPGDDKQADEEVLQAWGAGPAKIEPSAGNGTVTFYSWTQPTINIPIQVVVIT